MLVVCCGMPRSGSTLQFNMVWKVAASAGRGKRLDWRPSSTWENEKDELLAAVASDQILVMKTHQVPRIVRDLAEGDERVRFVYVHRDIRDVVYSMKLKFNFSLSHALSRVGDSVALEDWLSAGPKGEVLVQDYEKLLTDLSDALREVAGWIGVELDAESVESIRSELDIGAAFVKSRAKRVRFEHVRRLVSRMLRRRPTFADEELMLHPNHVSEHRGQPGVWRVGLTESEVAAIESRFGERIRTGCRV